MPFCPQCGSTTESGQDFCRSCGAALPRPGPFTSRSAGSSTPSELSRSLPETRLSPLMVLGFAGILIIIGAAAFFLFSGFSPSTGIQNSSGDSQDPGIVPINGQCSPGLSLCSGKCVDFKTDGNNCGACGFSVPYGETCINGQFSSALNQNKTGSSPVLSTSRVPGVQGTCPSGQRSCSGTCRDLKNDAGNCGSCGITCPSTQTCQNGQCIPPVTSAPFITQTALITITPDLSCSYGEIPCGSSCVNVFIDKKNCGVCGRTCGSQEACVNARCGPACTEGGTTLCDDKCVDLDTDMNNCGACGTECETFLPNAKGSQCAYGECIISECKADYADCNENLSDGCEIFLRTDAANCGSCGEKCSTGMVCYNKKCSTPIGL